MTDKECNGNCCDFYKDYDNVEDDYDIERLEDIIEICEFLIQTKKHRKEKKEAFKKIFEEESDDKEEDFDLPPFHVYKVKKPRRTYPSPYIPYWDRIWF